MAIADFESDIQAIELSGLRVALEGIRESAENLQAYLVYGNVSTRALAEDYIGKKRLLIINNKKFDWTR